MGRGVSGYRQRADSRTGQRYYEHRAVAEWHLGRPPEPPKIVHHRNEDKSDDHPENLLVLPSAQLTLCCTGFSSARLRVCSTSGRSTSGSSCGARDDSPPDHT